jgi:hypothetical protein
MEGRTCTNCGEFKLFSEFNIAENKASADGSTYKKYRAKCKPCLKEKISQNNKRYLAKHGDEIRARHREQWRLKNPPKETKPKRTPEEDEEYQKKSKERKKKYYVENKEKYKEYRKQYYQNNKEKMKALTKKWMAENKERHYATHKAYRDANREKINAQQKAKTEQLFAENPEKIRQARRATKARMKAQDPRAWNDKMKKYNYPAQRRMVEELKDAYVRQRLTRANDDGPRTISAKDIPQSLVEAKRLQLMILRSLRNEKR